MTDVLDIVVRPEVKEDTETRSKDKPLDLYHVILHDSPHHTFEYVVYMLMEIFSYDTDMAIKHTYEVHEQGQSIVATTYLEKAELYQEQISSYGKDILVAECKGSMFATLEKA